MTDCASTDPVITVVLTRPGNQSDLVIPPECPDGAGLWWNALALPDWSMRYTYAPPSAWVPGSVLLGAVPDAGALTLQVAARGTDSASLQVQKGRVEAAFKQWSYQVTVLADDLPLGSWEALPVTVGWGAVTPQRAGLFVAEASLSVPVNPTGAP